MPAYRRTDMTNVTGVFRCDANAPDSQRLFPYTLRTDYFISLSQITYVYYKKTTGNTNFFFPKCKSTQEVFLQHISTLQHVLLMLIC